MNEVKFRDFVKTHSYVTEVDLGTVLRCKHQVDSLVELTEHAELANAVYINHRPVFGLSPLQVGQAFKMLGSKQKDEKHWSVDRNTLLSLLQEKGEDYYEDCVYCREVVLISEVNIQRRVNFCSILSSEALD